MDRKKFIKTCSLACLGTTAMVSLLEGCVSPTFYARSEFAGNQLIIKKSEFTRSEKGKEVQRAYVLIKTDKLNFPVCVYKISSEEYSALLMECTHNSCELNPQGSFLVCPCHGSEFTNKGIVQNPPAERDLRSFKITTDHENIYVQL